MKSGRRKLVFGRLDEITKPFPKKEQTSEQFSKPASEREQTPERSHRKQELSPDQVTPMDRRRDEVMEFFSNHESSVLVAHTGAGKTTRGPDFLFKTLGPDSRIAVTVPRVNIAVSVPEYVADLNGYSMNREVGYQVRFDDRTDRNTNLNFMTDGIMLRKIVNDPLLKNYDAVMVDEAHERSLNIDLVMGLLKQAQKLRKEQGHPPLKVVISSATIEKEKFAEYFGTEAMKEIEGKMFPVEEHYAETIANDYVSAAAEKCEEIVTSGEPGDILVFMPGREEIKGTIQCLSDSDITNRCEILELHASVSKEEQKRVITKRGDTRRIIVSTNIAEAGVTVDGIRHVVDSGLIKETDFDPKMHIRKLETKEHSQAGLRQRRGRAGRVTDGVYHALYTRESFEERPAYSKPEIQRTNLANLVLIMKKSGIDNVRSFDFIDKPDLENIDAAVQELKMLGALDEQEAITSVGETMADLPLEPRIARMVVEGLDRGCVGDIVTIAAFFDERRKLFVRPRGKEDEADRAHLRFQDDSSDFVTFMNIWKEYKNLNGGRYQWARENFLNAQALDRVRQTRMQMLRVLRNGRNYEAHSDDPEAVGKSVFAGLVSNFVRKNSRFSYGFVRPDPAGFSHGMYMFIHPSSSVYRTVPDLCVAGEIFTTDTKRGPKTWLSPVQRVKQEWISEIAPQLLETSHDSLEYDPQKDGVYRHTVQRIKDVQFQDDLPPSVEKVDSNPDAVRAFSEWLVQHPNFADFTRNNQQVMDRYNVLRARNGSDIQENQMFSGSFSKDCLRDLYSLGLTHAGNASSMRDLKRHGISLSFSLEDFISRDTQRAIYKENPNTITVGGKMYRVQYITDPHDGYYAKIEMRNKDILKLGDIPSLPSGRKVYVQLQDAFSENKFNDIESLKQDVRNRLNTVVWEKWKLNNQDRYERQQHRFDPLTSDLSLPNPIVYGNDGVTGDPLTAHPARVVGWGGIQYSIRYYREENEAKKENAETLQRIKELRDNVAQQEESERLRDSIRKKVKKLRDFALDRRVRPPRLNVVSPEQVEMLWGSVQDAERKLNVPLLKAAETSIERASDIADAIEEKEAACRDSDALINKVMYGDLLKESELGIPSDVESVRRGGVSVPSNVLKRINFSDKNQVLVSNVSAKKSGSGYEYIIAQILVDRSGAVLFADDRENMILGDDSLVWDDGIADEVWVDDYEIFYSEEEIERRERGVPDDSYFVAMSIDDLENEFESAGNPERKKTARRHLISALEEKIKSSDKPFEVAILRAKLKDLR